MKKKKLLAGILAVAMVLTMSVPAALSAGQEPDEGVPQVIDGEEYVAEIDGTQYETVAAAITASEEGDTITMIADSTENVTINKSLTLDLNGHTLDGSGKSAAVITVNASLELNLTDSSTNGGGTITGGKSTYGGGVYLNNGKAGAYTSAIVSNVTVTNNTASNYGGGIGGYNYINIEVKDGATVSNNTASNYGAGIGGHQYVNIEVKDGATISGNSLTSSSGYGGGIYVQHYSEVNIYDGALITDNHVQELGGGVCVYGESTLHMYGGTISYNSVDKSSSWYGGGVHVEGPDAEFIMDDGLITHNASSAYGGGGVSFASIGGNNVTFTMNGGEISYNEATGAGTDGGNDNGGGGVLFNRDYMTFIMNGGSIINNVSSGDGGGVSVTSSSTNTVELNGGTIAGNTAGTYGGGISLGAANVTIKDVEIKDNTAGTYGGGIGFDGAATVSMENVDISGNTAGTYGGGIYLNTAKVTAADDVTITGNTAATAGGGVYDHTSGNFTVNGTTVIDGNVSGVDELTNPDGTDDNYYLATTTASYTIVLGDEISDDTLIGITTSTKPNAGASLSKKQDIEFTTQESLTGNSTTSYYLDALQMQNFYSDDPTYGVIAKEASNKGYLALSSFKVSLDGDAEYELNAEATALTPTVDYEGENDMTDSFTYQWYSASRAKGGKGTLLDGATDATYTPSTEEKGSMYYYCVVTLSDGTSATTGRVCITVVNSAEGFIESYVSDGDVTKPYTEATAENYKQILSGEESWESLGEKDDETQKAIDALLQTNSGDNTLTYEDLLAAAKAIDDAVTKFEESYLTDENNDLNALYTEVTADNYEQILSGSDAWEALSEDVKAAINADLTAANGGEELTYPDLVKSAQTLANSVNKFIEDYASDGDADDPYTEATTDNYQTILSGEDTWGMMTNEQKDAINAKLTEAYIAAHAEDYGFDPDSASLTFDDLLDQAKAIAADAFIESYASDGDVENPYTAADADNYLQILSGEDEWDAMDEETKDKVNAKLTDAYQAAGNTGTLTFDDLLSKARAIAAAANDFIEKYASDGDAENPYTVSDVNQNNYEQILSGEADWDAMTGEQQAAVNAKLADASGDPMLTFEALLDAAKAVDAALFEQSYLTDDENPNDGLYTKVTAENYEQILSGADDWNDLSEEAKKQVNDDLTTAYQAAGGDGDLTYPDLVAAAQALSDSVNAFIENYASDGDANDPYTAADADNYLQILSGEDEWNEMSPEQKAAVNDKLTAAYIAEHEGDPDFDAANASLTFDDLLDQARAIATAANAFIENYASNGDADDPYTAATTDNYQTILSGEDEWNAMTDEEKAAVNAKLTEAYIAAHADDPDFDAENASLTFDDLLDQAKAIAADAFIESYASDGDADDPYTAADADNYLQILSGEDEWDAMDDVTKDYVNGKLTDAYIASHADDPDFDAVNASLTFDDLLDQAKAIAAEANAFIESYASDGDAKNPYTEATADNYLQILSGEDEWNAMSPEQKAAINAKLQAASGIADLTFDDLLAQAHAISDAVSAFEESYLTDPDDLDAGLYITVTADNYEQIISGELDWDALTDEEKAAVNADLTAAYQAAGYDGDLTYPELLDAAKAFADSVNAFIESYASDGDAKNPYTEATIDNYLTILSGEDEWNAMSPEQKAAINAKLQAASGIEDLTFEDLLAQAHAISDALAEADEAAAAETSGVAGAKTADVLPIMILLLIAALCAEAVLVSCRRRMQAR